jgi:hypothetical protein
MKRLPAILVLLLLAIVHGQAQTRARKIVISVMILR